MVAHVGVILIEREEISMHVYQIDGNCHFLLLSNQHYPLPPVHMEIVNVIAEFLTIGSGYQIEEWKICLRFNSPIIAKQIFSATGLQIESLTLAREQELLLRGMTSEML